MKYEATEIWDPRDVLEPTELIEPHPGEVIDLIDWPTETEVLILRPWDDESFLVAPLAKNEKVPVFAEDVHCVWQYVGAATGLHTAEAVFQCWNVGTLSKALLERGVVTRYVPKELLERIWKFYRANFWSGVFPEYADDDGGLSGFTGSPITSKSDARIQQMDAELERVWGPEPVLSEILNNNATKEA